MSATPFNEISVVICAYSAERWEDLVAAVGSVQAQAPKPRQIIVVVDNNKKLLARVRDRMPGVTAVENTATPGAGQARNCGVSLATSTIIAFLDDDATASPSWIENALRAFTDPDVLGVGGTIQPAWDGQRPRWMAEEFYWTIGCTYPGLPGARSPVRNLIAANMFMRRAAFTELGGFRSGFGKTGARSGTEETDLCIRASQRWPEKKWLYDPAVAVAHRVPRERSRVRYFISRCYDEGAAKASIVHFVGKRDGLAAERTYTTRTLPRGVLRGFRAAILEGDLAGIARSISIAAGLGATLVGYLSGRLTRRTTRRAG